MEVTCSIENFKQICQNSGELPYIGTVIFVLQADLVTDLSLFNTDRLSIVFTLNPKISKAALLVDFPSALEVRTIKN